MEAGLSLGQGSRATAAPFPCTLRCREVGEAHWEKPQLVRKGGTAPLLPRGQPLLPGLRFWAVEGPTYHQAGSLGLLSKSSQGPQG